GMLDVKPPPGLRGRVLARIETTDPVGSAFGFLTDPVASAFRRKALWVAVPAAAAAVILLAVLGPWRRAIEPAPSSPPAMANAAHPVPNPIVPPPPAPPIALTTTEIGLPYGLPDSTPPRRALSPARPGLVVAAAAPATEDVVWIDSLPGPAAIDVAAIQPGKADPVRSIELPAAQIPALDVRPLSDTPRERRNQE
ncbi:MAG TPA: hypothetical protein VKH34_13955, partial [Vicinamibacterales bacterium]|nr:hypothetical protein [Vicinamibacterales bacterium]